ncbi:MAG: cation diffusion facilitator family transporter [Chloroflexota bacterium]
MFNSKTSVAALSVASNLTLTLLKLAVGVYIGSVSIVAEAIHSGVDLLAAIIAFLAVRSSGRPPDDDHPFGHGKIENVSGTVEAVLIFAAAGLIMYEAAQRLLHGIELPQVDLGLVVMALSVVVNIVVSRQLFKVARRTDSIALEADGYHLTTDVLTSLGVLAGLVVVRLTGLAILDPIVALAVAGIIVKAALDITRRSFVDLLDRSLPESERQLVVQIIQDHKDRLVGVHRVRTRKAGSERHVDLHLVVNGQASVAEAHALCDHLERDLYKALGSCSTSIHVEPCRQECETCTAKCEVRSIDNSETGDSGRQHLDNGSEL